MLVTQNKGMAGYQCTEANVNSRRIDFVEKRLALTVDLLFDGRISHLVIRIRTQGALNSESRACAALRFIFMLPSPNVCVAAR